MSIAIAVWAGLAPAGGSLAAQERPYTVQPLPRLAAVDSLLALGRVEAALTLARELAASRGTDPLYGWQIAGREGLVLLRLERFEEAIAPLEKAVIGNPADPVLHRNLAFALRRTGRRGRALTEYRDVVRLAPGDADARLEFGQTLVEFQDFRNAEQELRVAERLCGGCLQAVRGLVNVYLATGRPREAAEGLQRIWREEPTPQVRRLLAAALDGAGDHQGVVDLLETVADEDLTADEWRLSIRAEQHTLQAPAGPSRSLACARALSADGEPWPAEIALDDAFWAMAARNLLDAGLNESALAAATRSVELAPGNAAYRNNLVVILLALGRQDEARREWDKALELDPGLEAKESPDR